MTVEKLYEGDKRLEVLLNAVKDTIYERGEGLPIPAIIGVLELVKLEIVEESRGET